MMDGTKHEERKSITISGGIIDEFGICKPSKGGTRKARPAPVGPKTAPALRSRHLEEIRKGYLELTQRLEAAQRADPAETRPAEILAPMPAKEEKKNEEFLSSLDFMTEFVKKTGPSAAAAAGLGNRPVVRGGHQITPPKWGCLKNGELPTFRTWQKTRKYSGGSAEVAPLPPRLTHLAVQEGKHRVFPPTPPPASQPAQPAAAHQPTGHYVPGPPAAPIKLPASMGLSKGMGLIPGGGGTKQKRVVRRTFRVGKSKKAPVVSVVLNSQHIRERIATQKKTLKRAPIHQIKQKLVQAGMIRVGSIAPENVLREIYENMYLIGGPVMNFSPDIMYYNMLNPSSS